MSSTPALSTPQVFEPRERAAVWATLVVATAVVLWAAYLLAAAQSWRLDGLILGGAVASSGAAVTVSCRYTEQKANSREHQAVLDDIASLRTEVVNLHDDNRRVIALLQELADQGQQNVKREYDWSAYTDGLRDAITGDDSEALASVTPMRPPHGRQSN